LSIETEADVVPLSFAQERLWFLDQMAPGNPFYNLQIDIPLRCAVDENVWARVLSEIIRRHEILRTTFHSQGGQPVQRVLPLLEVPLRSVDLRQLPIEQREDAAQNFCDEDARRPFDLTQGPLLRVTLARLDDEASICYITMHHIVTDGWSMDVLTHEIAVLYDAFACDQPTPLPELPIQYADFAVWQRQAHAQAELERQLAYWRTQLQGYRDLEVPTDYPRPPVSTYRGGFQSMATAPAIVEGLRRLSQKEGATLFMTLLAAFQVLMMRYSGQDDVVVGTPIANRTHPELEPLIGFFVNTLVIRGRLAGRPTFREFLRTTRETALSAYSNQDLPFERVVEELQPRRDLSRNPIFQVMFVLQTGIGPRSAPAPSPAYQGGPAKPSEASYGNAKFDLTLYITEDEGGLSAIFEYSTDLFADDTITRLIAHWQTLLQSIAVSPDTVVTRLPILPPNERSLLLDDWNRTASNFPRDASLGELFSAQVAATPDAIALTGAEGVLTYQALEERTNRLARWLRDQGVQPGEPVGIQLPRGQDMVVAVLATVKAGGAYLPLDPTYPQARLDAMIRDAQPRVVLAEMPELPEDASPLASVAGPETLAYILYTSGSTGKPKGVCVTHRNVVRLVRNTNYCEFDASDVFLQFAPLQFDASTFEIWGPLLNGARLEIAPAGLLSLEDLAALIERSGITTLWLTASLFHHMVDGHLGSLWRVRQMLAGGDVISPSHAKRFLDELPNCTLINGYGPTETTTFAVCHRMRHGDSFPGRVPIGRPISNARVYVLDEEMQLVPVGVPGELYIGGDGLAVGYLSDEELTAARFLPDPFSPAGSGTRLYRTGDQVRYSGDGVLDFLGRRDRQVKLRGFRIELSEIEAVMRQHPLVHDSCAVIRSAAGEQQIVGYAMMDVSPAAGLEVRRYLQQQLPGYMVPSVVVPLREFPLTSSGKVDREALPAPASEDWTGDVPFAEPQSETELLISAVWCEVLQIERAGLHENFFDLGGHSLLLVQVHSRLTDLFGTGRVSIVDLFRFPTVATLAAHLKNRRTGAGDAREDRLGQVDERMARQRQARAERVQRRGA